jgi:SAM-dependent methyltransferase
LQKVWEDQAKSDPLWAILSEPDKQGRKWNLGEFLETGERDIAHVMDIVVRSGRTIRLGTAVDFGCGIGRLTQPLADRFDQALGIDVSPTMIELARRIKRGGSRVQYSLNTIDNLAFIPDAYADLVLSHLVLQHIPPTQSEFYLREFFRIAKPLGWIIFQVPSHLRPEQTSTDAQGRLPLKASSASFRVEQDCLNLPPGTKQTINVFVTNRSTTVWRQMGKGYEINLGNHWLDAKGKKLVHDDARSRLPDCVSPNEEVPVSLQVSVPEQPGRYRLQMDVVQEGLRWFADAGSRVAEITVLAGNPDTNDSGAYADEPERIFEGIIDPQFRTAKAFAMYCIPRTTVESIIQELRSDLVHVEEHVSEWYSYRYYVQVRG